MTSAEIQYRLNEIADTSLQNLDDEAVLALLNERKELLVEAERLQKEEDEEQGKRKELEAKKESLKARLAEINASITPDQDDEKLLALIQERKTLETELKSFEEEPSPEPVAEEKKAEAPAEAEKPEQGEEESASPDLPARESNETEEEVVAEEKPEPKKKKRISKPASEKIAIDSSAPYTETFVSKKGQVSALEHSEDRVVLDSSLQTGEYQGYLSELKANLNSLGTFLQSLPVEVKRNRAFMVEVAKIDPAYAMHYADKDTLKKDETFNVAIAGMNNQRNTGNPLSEMLPEMRTGKVVLAGVKNDFRNVRFVRPEMPEYEEIIDMAKKGALEAVKSLKGAHDIRSLLPPVLQKDKAFMAQAQKLIKE